MGPQTSSENFITPPPAPMPDVEVAAPATEMITVPESIVASQEEQRQRDADDQLSRQQDAAEAARRIMETKPDFGVADTVGVAPETQAAPAPIVSSTNGGRFGNGVVEGTAMPPDPSKAIGWNGQVRR